MIAEWDHGYNPKNPQRITWQEFYQVKKGKATFAQYCDQYGFNHKPALLPGNYLAMSVIEQYLPIFVNGMGGIQAEGIKLVIDNLPWIIDADKSDLILRIMTYVSKAIEVSNDNNEDDNQWRKK